ncbi:MAG: phycobiliprotein lyase [Synechococcaceae cyanobacterium]
MQVPLAPRPVTVTNAPPPAALDAPFPPASLAAFLALCACEWLALRSQFLLGDTSAAEQRENGWHSSERGELRVEHLEPRHPGEAGGLVIQAAAAAQPAQVLFFDSGGQFTIEAEPAVPGNWRLWPDGSLELVCEVAGVERRERIWFTKPNLRLRSCVEQRADGAPARASFSSEIRRLKRPDD